jgi:hypothetical protein
MSADDTKQIANPLRKRGRPVLVSLSWFAPILFFACGMMIGSSVPHDGRWLPGLDWDFAGIIIGGISSFVLGPLAIRRREAWYGLAIPPLLFGVWVVAMSFQPARISDTWNLFRSLDYRHELFHMR